ncbi:MAG: DUF1016 N-terminal domain-containing protein, partial [bacterium]|nr:DUF1016 N-terminal domain-containing protein [bacterium]
MSQTHPAIPYAELRDQIAQILTEGKERARRAVERETVRTAWEIGHLVHNHLLSESDRADYGEQLVLRLSQDVGIDWRKLYEMLKFYRLFPILPTS